MNYRQIRREDDAAIAGIIRDNLKQYNLDVPGTVYFDKNLDHISDFYLADSEKRYYFIAIEGEKVCGGIGLAEVDFFEDCAELQKLYLSDEAKGQGFGYELIAMIEDKARQLGYKRMYLETHTNLEAAIHIYEKAGYRQIPRPEAVVHGGMDRFYIKDLL
ncbi:GNAT family N-acetyltransferase [Butyrivibrio sp. INlla16]|uniref:GNAT family N-acetyltransferase n=1 Tax=Butyrivibrio sp. INlla16 TaxID=1520807 RepID=UPI0008880A0A|nr:GNAT family N-acetyltransferase [Butyrivibrio sp. INlla16]SDB50051.1 putative acetyltransferase [Butyrivibrio sp. INlla16]